MKKARKKARYEANKHAHDDGGDEDDYESVYEPTGWYYKMETGVGRSGHPDEEMVVAGVVAGGTIGPS